jgi:hypothetical protein
MLLMMTRHNNALAIVKNAVKKPVTIQPNSTVQILGYTDKEIPYSTTTAMLHYSSMFNVGVANIDVIFSKYIFKGLYKNDSSL